MTTLRSALLILTALALTACGSSGAPPASSAPDTAAAAPQTFRICPGPNAQAEALEAFFDADEGDTIEFCAGLFTFTSGLLLSNARGITIRGAGMDETFLNFANSNNKEGLFASHVTGLTIEDLTVEDMPGDGIKFSDARFVTVRRTRVRWTNATPGHANYDATMESWAANGAYAYYPVLSEDVIVEDSEAIGSSDVGFYIGQSQDVIIRNNLAYHNVQGYEFENTDNSEMYDNEARDNAGGFLVVDLPGRTRYGDKNRLYRNTIHNNNINNFAPKGTIAAAVPRGPGIIVLATDQVEIFDNDINNNDTLGIVVVSYRLLDRSRDPRYDYYAEGIHIHSNRFADNGTNPQEPDPDAGDSTDPGSNPTVLPALIQAKNMGQMAHIVWDGYTDTLNDGCEAPQGIATDERGKPDYRDEESARDCGEQSNGDPVRYNAYKFDDNGELILPINGLCIQNNSFADTGVPLPEFVNFQGTVPGDLDDIAGDGQDRPTGSRDQSPHDCSLPALPATVVEEFSPGGGSSGAPSEEEVRRICESVVPGQVNRAALPFNCPELSHYGLFANTEEPRSGFNGGGVPYELTTPLFSDYAIKYRVVFLPPGQAAQWQDSSAGPNAHIQFPVGTVIAKTFAFRDDTADPVAEDVIETRLLIKRDTDNGILWQGLPYVWETAPDGSRRAVLTVAGASVAASWDYEDPDPNVVDATGNRLRYAGSTDDYQVPQASQCVTCHAREFLEAGSAPIGPKVRGLNRDHDYGAAGVQNQLAFWCDTGMLTGCPADLNSAEQLAVWNVPGSAGFDAGSDEDIEARTRAYFEANCAHCHNPRGVAKSTRMYLDRYIDREGIISDRPVDRDHGICKSPVASGRGTGDRIYDIVPGDPEASILEFRVGNGDDAAIRMPPVAKSVVHTEGHALIRQWIGILPLPTTQDDNCSAGAAPVP